MNGADEAVLTGLHFLRPAWLLGLPLLAALAAYWWRRTAVVSSPWDAVVDPALRAYVIEGADEPAARRPRAPFVLFAGWALACLLLAGPVFERQEVEVQEAHGAEVVLLDLSRSMRADDLRPDRMTRARYKLDELLAREERQVPDDAGATGDDRAGGTGDGEALADGDGAGDLEVGLVAFAERPYTVSPLTDDAATVRAFLPSLVPEIAPVQGSRMDLAIERGVELLERGLATDADGLAAAPGSPAGHLLLVTDGMPDDAAIEAARHARNLGHRLSVLGVGTGEGAPLRDAEGRFLTTGDGSIVVPRLDIAALRRLAGAGGGVAVALTDDASDLAALESVRDELAPGDVQQDGQRSMRRALWWVERTPWLVPVLAAGALLQFRRRIG